MIPRVSGATFFSLLATGFAAVHTWLVNPLFMDDPWSYLWWVVVPLSLTGWCVGPMVRPLLNVRVWVLISSLLFLSALARPTPDRADTRLLVVGIDGVTWPVVERTTTPHLDRMKKEGLSGTLIAEEPLFSPLLWTTIASGRPTIEHGIQGIRTRSDQARVPRFWDIARSAGLSVGLYKWLVTWPPPADEVPGFTVPAWLAGDARTHPSSLSWVKELELSRRTHRKKVGPQLSLLDLAKGALVDGIRWSTLRQGVGMLVREQGLGLAPSNAEIALRRLRLRIDRDVFVHQLHTHQPDVATFTMYLTDALSHTHWSAENGRHVDEAYGLSDAFLGELIASVAEDAHVLVLSDHGFRDARSTGEVHTVIPKIGVLKSYVEKHLGPVEIVRVGRQLALTPEESISDQALVDALSPFQYADGSPLYVVDRFDRGGGWGLKVSTVPPRSTWSTTEVAGFGLDQLLASVEEDEGEHDASGVVILSGPQVDVGDLGRVPQIDVAPTILALLNLPVANDMPGAAWVEEPVPRVTTYDHLAPKDFGVQGATNEERLQQLGYID